MEGLPRDHTPADTGFPDSSAPGGASTDPLDPAPPRQDPAGAPPGSSPAGEERDESSNSSNSSSSSSNHAIGYGDNDFTADYNRSRFRSAAKYARAVLALASAFVLDLTSAGNTTLVSVAARVSLTLFAYAVVYTSASRMLLMAIAYLMNHGWYLLAASCALILLLGCGILLAVCEWMWRWQDRALSVLDRNNIGYDRLRSVNVLDDDEMEDGPSLRAWVRRIGSAVFACLVWSLFCALSANADAWIADAYKGARPSAPSIELRLVGCLEGLFLLAGAALLLYVACPSFYRLHLHLSRPGALGTAAVPLAHDERGLGFGGGLDFDFDDNDNYTITVREDEVTVGRGIQNLIL
ncbi:unnamed protein product [Pseudo-nitzschia multistriata]|uniref:Uncharacterized protein n=1 Tax=Pseudo-nitzschia multistriata TaxID=183589 RepID=A0A448ZHE2_9STRA|nr:unnamed protein product [Pseudo-nitzschia multistriata]